MFAKLPPVVGHASRVRVFSYSSYFMFKGHSMAIGFNPNHRSGSKAGWTMLSIVKRLVSLSVLFPETVVLGLDISPGV